MSKIKDIKGLINRVWFANFEPYWGSLGQIKQHWQDRKKQPSLETAINNFEQRWSEVKSNNKTSPIFIFSAGWRSGSTLLQRLIMSSGEVTIWGEPYSHNNLIGSLAEPLKGFTDVYPRESWFLTAEQYNIDHLTQNFTANLYPDLTYLIESHIAFFEHLFALPAKNLGFSRWGIKDVRLNIDSAFYLRWLFPNAKFIFLYRNPYKAYTSFAGSYWYKTYPRKPIYSPKQFGQNWQHLTQGFVDKCDRIGGKLISYESLCSREFDFRELSDYLDLEIDTKVLDIKIKGDIKEKSDRVYFNHKHLKILQKNVNPLAYDLGYEFE